MEAIKMLPKGTRVRNVKPVPEGWHSSPPYGALGKVIGTQIFSDGSALYRVEFDGGHKYQGIDPRHLEQVD